ncbi:MAG: DUF2306 domain-containing protein [Alphaproteobacteria bacterium]
MNIEPILNTSRIIQIHLLFAVLGLLLGISQLVLPKGTLRHKIIGYMFVCFLAVLSLVSFFIRELFPAMGLGAVFFGFSPIHLLSIFVLYSLIKAMSAIKQGNVKQHEKSMKGIFFYGLILAGTFTFFPGRLLFEVFFNT